ncbi:DUF6274 family protein [Streptomyces sp. NPDC005780]|uniref:DUF6274 family protein n=1 Tax=Streptomyces sp. NPDC005780 TaxID=3364730 RepID=UPI0036CD4717
MAASTSENFLPDRSGAREPVPAQPSGTAPAPVRRRTPRHEIRALLRAHLAAASGYRHLTRHCAVCARLLKLAMEPLTAAGATGTASTPLAGPGQPEPPQAALTSPGPHESAQAGLTGLGATGTAPAPPAGSGPPGATPPAVAAPEQTGVHVMPCEAREQTVQPVTGSRSTPSPATGPASAHSAAPDTGPHALARRPASTWMTTHLAPAHASASPGSGDAAPGGGDPGPDGWCGPGWAEDESPPAA